MGAVVSTQRKKPLLAKELRDALQAAQEHLNYVGYGDVWERDCARQSKLEERINAALERAAKELK